MFIEPSEVINHLRQAVQFVALLTEFGYLSKQSAIKIARLNGA
jgi:hypothetical protein